MKQTAALQVNAPTHHQPWLEGYPPGVPPTVEAKWECLTQLLTDCFEQHGHRRMATFMGRSYRFEEIDQLSRQLATWLRHSGLGTGDRVAVMMPNVPQYLVCIAAILRAGMVVVNVNPLYTSREVNHQLRDSGAKGIVALENFAQTLEASLQGTQVQQVVLTELADMLSAPKRLLVNGVIRHVKKLIAHHTLTPGQPGPVQVCRFNDALTRCRATDYLPVTINRQDLAFIQYTGGTTGVSKGAMLSHGNLCSNIAQVDAWFAPAMNGLRDGDARDIVCALPLYHIFALTGCFFMGLKLGMNSILIPNPRDTDAMIKSLQRARILMFPGVNTLFNTLLGHASFRQIDFSGLKVTIGGGMAVSSKTAREWCELTKCPIAEGYGLSETSPVVSLNALNVTAFTGSIGMPLPGTDVKIVDDDDLTVALGERGEICVRGPQVMQGYWNRPEETRQVMTHDGYFKTGDVGVLDELGHIRIVDRKKDMVLVSGFNVYPSEIEEVINQMHGVLESAVIGIHDERSGEAVKAFVVPRDANLTADAIKAHCEKELTGYKRPKHIVLCKDLPKTPVGKILRRELRDFKTEP